MKFTGIGRQPCFWAGLSENHCDLDPHPGKFSPDESDKMAAAGAKHTNIGWLSFPFMKCFSNTPLMHRFVLISTLSHVNSNSLVLFPLDCDAKSECPEHIRSN